jgi:hypothetical protein
MADDQLQIRLQGEDDGPVDFADFRTVCDGLSECLFALQRATSPDAKRPKLQITDLAAGSAAVSLRAPTSAGADAISRFLETVSALQRGKPLATWVDTDSLRKLRKLADVLNRHTKGLWVQGVQITSQFTANIDAVIGTESVSEGSATGTLDTVNVHNRNEFALYPRIGPKIKCTFRDEMLDEVKAGIKCTVTINGRLAFAGKSAFPHRAIVRAMRRHERPERLPPLSALRGAAPDLTGGLGITEFLRGLRDD